VMQIAQILSGYTLGGADVLRRAMGKKIKSEMDAQRSIFVEGAVKNGIKKDKASLIFDLVDKFAGYGFNKSHAAAYALVAYQTGYLKANYPVEFMAASMTFDMGNADRLTAYRRELQRLDIALLPPDVNASEATFSVEDGAIRYALAALKNVGRSAMEAMVREREANGPYESVADFATRLDTTVVNRRQIENLIKAGAFDSLNPNRRQLFDGVDLILRLANSASGERDSNQSNLFGDSMASDAQALPLPNVLDWPVTDRLRNEFDAIGLYLSAHPLDAYEKSLERLNISTYSDIAHRAAAGRAPATAKLAGTVIGRKERRSARGNKFAFIQLSDPSGMFEITAFSEVLANARDLLESAVSEGTPVLVTADVRSEEDSVRLLAQAITPLDNAVAASAAGLRVWVTDPAAVEPLASVVAREKQGRGRVQVVVPLGSREAHISLPKTYMISPATRQAIKSIPGIMHVEEV
ncbi:MAG: OB-fold nucleic acid binding domain-containing protein, partial [Bauldia litoralis]